MKRILLLLSVFFLICSLVSSCFTPWRGDGGALTVSIGGGNSNSRSVLKYIYEEGTLYENTFSVDSEKLTRHIITVTDSSGVEQSLTIEGESGKVYFPSLALGLCSIVVEGYKVDEQQTLGTTTLDIKYGSNSTAIEMALSPLFIAKNVAANAEIAAVKLAEDLIEKYSYDDNELDVEVVYGNVVTVKGGISFVSKYFTDLEDVDKIKGLQLDIPAGVTVRWEQSLYTATQGAYNITLTGSGTLEITGNTKIDGGYSRGGILIASGSPTLKISCDPPYGFRIRTSIVTAPGSSPNIEISSGSVSEIRLAGDGTITVSGEVECDIKRVGNANVKGYYRNDIIRDYFDESVYEEDIGWSYLEDKDSGWGSGYVQFTGWKEGVNLFPIP